MSISNRIIERICRVFEHLVYLEKTGREYVSSSEIAKFIGATDYTVRKDISLIGVTGYSRKGYEVALLKKQLGDKFLLSKKRKACIVGLGRLGSALLDYEKFQEDGFEIIAGFDCSINKIERIHSAVDVFHVSSLDNIVRERHIELGIITTPPEASQEVADKLCTAGVKGILNFSNAKVIIPENIIYMDMDFTSALRFLAARLTIQGRLAKKPLIERAKTQEVYYEKGV